MDNTPAPRQPRLHRASTPPRRPVRRSDGRHDRVRDPALFAVASAPRWSRWPGRPTSPGSPRRGRNDRRADRDQRPGRPPVRLRAGRSACREQICDVMRLEGIEAHPDDVAVTVGSQQAVDLVTRSSATRATSVICEAPSYVGRWASSGLPVRGRARGDGRRRAGGGARAGHPGVKAAGKTIKFLYTIPNFHNPGGVTLSVERRPEILRICREHDILVLEDNLRPARLRAEPMQALRADGRRASSTSGRSRRRSRPACGSAGRSPTVREKLVLAQVGHAGPPSFSQMAVSAYPQHDWQGQIKQMREMYRERRDAMMDALHDFMPAACTWNGPTAASVWLTLPPGIDAKAMPAPSPRGWPTSPAPRSSRTASARARCACRSASRPRSGSARAYPARGRARGRDGAPRDVRRQRPTRGLEARSGYDSPGTDLS